MGLYATILSDWTSAVKARDSAKSLTLSNIKAALLNRAVELGTRQAGLTEEQTLGVLQKMQKQAEDAIASMPGESTLKTKEMQELSIINSYLPKRLSADEVRQRVYEILNGSDVRDLGAGMKLCLAQLKAVADGKHVQLFVKQFIEEKNG